MSYFVFIRWLLFMDVIILLLNFVFLVLPQYTFLPVRAQIPVNLTLNETINADFSVAKDLRKQSRDFKVSLKWKYLIVFIK